MDKRTWTELVRLKHSSFRPRSFPWPGKKVLCVPKEENIKYRKVATSRPVYYSILNSFGRRSQYISINFPLHKQFENP